MTQVNFAETTSNKTDTVTIDALEINYEFGEFKTKYFTNANSLTFETEGFEIDPTELESRTLGTEDWDYPAIVLFFIFPVLIGLILSYIFGIRQRK